MTVSRRDFCTVVVGGALTKTAGAQVNIFEQNAKKQTAMTTDRTDAGKRFVNFYECNNVKEFGAKGDGITDDTAPLSAYFAVGGKILFERDKKYLITRHVYLNCGNIDIDLNGSTIYCPTSKLIIFAHKNTTAKEYNGLNLITLRNGVLCGVSLGLAHNKHILIENVKFLNANSSHHIQIFSSSDVHIINCIFEGLLYTNNSAHYESINIYPGDYIAFPYFRRDSITYDGTKNKNIYIERCTFKKGYGRYKKLESTIGTHYDDGLHSWHENIFIINCIIGIERWGIRANSWKNAIIRNCIIETAKFAFDCGYQKGAKNIIFSDSFVRKDYSIDSDNPIHFGPYRGDNICISNIVCIDLSGTCEKVKNIAHFSKLQSGENDILITPSRFVDIAPISDGLYAIGSEECRWAESWVASSYIKRANPHLNFVETDVEKISHLRQLDVKGCSLKIRIKIILHQ